MPCRRKLPFNSPVTTRPHYLCGPRSRKKSNAPTFKIRHDSTTGRQHKEASIHHGKATFFPVLSQPRQRFQPTENTRVTTKIQLKDHVTPNSKSQTQQTQKHSDDLKQHTEQHQAHEEMEVATPEPCTSEMKKTNRVHEQQRQHPQTTKESPETTERKDFTDLESLISDDSEDLQETPRNTPRTPRD
jgi:hypothetical protein